MPHKLIHGTFTIDVHIPDDRDEDEPDTYEAITTAIGETIDLAFEGIEADVVSIRVGYGTVNSPRRVVNRPQAGQAFRFVRRPGDPGLVEGGGPRTPEGGLYPGQTRHGDWND